MRFHQRTLVLLISLPVLVGMLVAQATGRLVGSVTDPSGASIPGATIGLLMPGGSKPLLTAVTTADGFFSMIGVQAGTYDLVVEAPGFRKYTERGVKIDPSRETSLSAIKLEVGAVSEVVEVSGSVQTVQTTNAEIAVTINKEQVRGLPVLNRSPLALISTQVGVISSTRSNTVINGLRTSFANVTIDGINIQDNFIRANALDFLPNLLLLDQVAEFTISTSNQNSVSSGGAAQVAFVTPSGTNQFHGSAYWFNRNNAVAANTWFNNKDGIARPFLNQNQVGATFGGPIWKDRLFFYTNYEAFRLRQQSTANRTILTGPARQGIFTYQDTAGATRTANLLTIAGVPQDPATKALLDKVPGPEKINNFRVGDSSEALLRNTAGYSFTLRNNRTRDNLSTKVDFNLSPRNSFAGTWLWNRDILDRTDLANDYSTVPKVSNDDGKHLASVGWRWNPTPSLTNELRGGFNLAPASFLTSEQFGSSFLTGTIFSNPLNTFRAQGRETNTYSLQDNASFVRGKHHFQFGFQGQWISTKPYNDAGITASYGLGIGSGNTGLTAAQLPGIRSTDVAGANNMLATLAGYITSYTQTFNVKDRTSGFVPGQTNLRNWTLNNYAGYFQDNWKVRPGWTLNLGLRYELYSPVDEANALVLLPRLVDNNPITTLLGNGTLDFAGRAVDRRWYKWDRNNFAPNVGLAWDVFGNGRTALRMGYGVFFANDETIRALDNNAGTNAGLQTGVSRTGLSGRVSAGLPAIPTPTFQVPRTFAQNYALSSTSAFGLPHPDLVTPYVQQWSLSLQQEWKGVIFEARYLGNHGTKEYRAFDFNQVVIRENGFLADFLRAQNNGNLALARGGSFDPRYNAAIPGSQPLPIFAQLSGGGGLTNTTNITLIQQGQVGALASNYQTDRLNGAINFYRNPNALGTNLMTNYSNSSYHAFQLDLRSRVRRGLQFQANYNFSKVLADASGDGQTRFEAFLDNDNPSIERARAPFDQTHALKGNYIYYLPMGDGHRFSKTGFNRFLSGWFTSGILTWVSGEPFSVLSQRSTVNRSGRSDVNTATTNLTMGQLNDIVKFRMTGNGPYVMASSAIGTDGRAVAPDGTAPFGGQVFFHPAAGTLGALQRRMFDGPPAFNLDFSLGKDTKITERQSVQIRMEASNIFNHPTFSVGDYAISSTTFGRITGTRFGRRLIQFSLQYRF